jgi:quinoprotein relay system zinc metallohydrolase 2
MSVPAALHHVFIDARKFVSNFLLSLVKQKVLPCNFTHRLANEMLDLSAEYNYMIILRYLLSLCLLVACTQLPQTNVQANEWSLNEVARGVYVHQPSVQESSAANQGDIANIGFIVGKKCVAAIDSGGSVAVGNKLRAAITRTTPLPVCYVINTHVHPDHIFGNAAFNADKPAFIGHAKLPLAMGSRAQNYLNAIKRDLGAAAENSVIVPPTQTLKDTLELDLGERKLSLRAWRTAHTDNDVTVMDETTGTLWLSDLLFVGHTPVVDGKLKGWLAVMEELRGIKATTVIPGHGAVQKNWPEAAKNQQRYLESLLNETRQMLSNRKTMQQAIDSVGISERNQWQLFDLFHKRNVTTVFAELEWED